VLFRTGESARNRKGIQRYAKRRGGEHWYPQDCRGEDDVFSAWLDSVLSDWPGRFVLVQITINIRSVFLLAFCPLRFLLRMGI